MPSPSPNALIIGASGQDGYYLAETCRAAGMEPVTISRSSGVLSGDVADYNFVSTAVKRHAPEMIFHLAANSTTGHDALFENHAAIATGALNILESVYRLKLASKVFLAGSGVQFQNTGAPISEETPFEAKSPYAVSRIQSVYAARYYRTLGVRAYVGYFFHHESPLRKPAHLSQKIATSAKRISQGSNEILEVGKLSVRKEWTFAGDTAKGVMALVQQERFWEAVIGSGEAHSIQDWIDVCFSHLGLDWRKHVRETEGFRPEYDILVSDPKRIFGLGWRPTTGFSQLAEMMVKAAR